MLTYIASPYLDDSILITRLSRDIAKCVTTNRSPFLYFSSSLCHVILFSHSRPTLPCEEKQRDRNLYLYCTYWVFSFCEWQNQFQKIKPDEVQVGVSRCTVEDRNTEHGIVFLSKHCSDTLLNRLPQPSTKSMSSSSILSHVCLLTRPTPLLYAIPSSHFIQRTL